MQVKPSIHQLVLCTANPGKIMELRKSAPEDLHLLDLRDVNIIDVLPETGNTLEKNALQKAQFVFERCGIPCLADDSGLEVDALGGEPGVSSAHYAGPEGKAEDNIRKLLAVMKGLRDRNARFRTVLALVTDRGVELFEGAIDGSIAEMPIGVGGFGYDPVFIPLGHDRTFAQMPMNEKNQISHRARAMERFLSYLRG